MLADAFRRPAEFRPNGSQDFYRPADMHNVIATAEQNTLRSRALASLASLPPFSPILNRLIATLSRDDISFARIAELIEKDTVLAGNVLRLVNSALYGRRATINSVRHAVSLLGMNKLRNATLGMSITRMWSQVRAPSGWSMARFNLHSVATAMLADLIAQEAAVDYAEGAFAAGLFHDLGRLLIAIALPDEHSQLNIMCSGSHVSRSECEQVALGFTHAELSAEALEHWNLPAQIRIAVLDHHTPQTSDDEGSLARLIGCADEIANMLGFAIEQTNTDNSIDDVVESTKEQLKHLALRNPKGMLSDFNKEFDAIRALF